VPDRGQPAHPRIREKAKFSSLARGMVDHKVADHIAKFGRISSQLNEANMESREEPGTLSNLWEQTWNERLLQVLTEHLRSHFAEHTLRAFELYVMRDMPVEQIATILGMTPNQIYVAKSRVVRHLRENCDEVLENLYGVER
jgi:DNA-directed RNA polymerase specialized sigma24 family protein